ncbi:hypothetical protein GCM10010924_39490 [Rhizobium wenxiniae]|uniref:Uncharacterized protein n=1 Tax=Rhizobium wenxiniae TaxID=1737357 RepID=A0A7W9Y9U4_9HYPH|nr:hypothetical protein [Rhizobium wenxiniae]GGG06864.1 hypothetical protein GCM10010924_39490 [Rhizobium wenxiniae]
MDARARFTNLGDSYYVQASRYSPLETIRRRIVSVAIYAASEDSDLVTATDLGKASLDASS